MITLYTTASSPNGQKIRVMLAETGLAYEPVRVDLHEGANRRPEYLAINPTGAVPALTDSDSGANVFETGAMLIYLAEKSGRFLPTAQPARADVLKWLLYEAATVGPILVNLYHLMYAPDDAGEAMAQAGRQRLAEAASVIETQLGRSEYVAGECSIADFALLPWMPMLEDFADIPLASLPNIERWNERMQSRPGVAAALSE
ncbi:MAG TPA: glutathione S-transferase family protein [Gammaproteobacteria bacterium]|nr:glutathione S-transferase family protein [Gammaproteobacteria bacterium]